MISIELPGREPIVLSDETAGRLYGALWDGAVAVRGSVGAAAQIKRAIALAERLRRPLVFDGIEADAVSAALLAMRAHDID